MVTRARLAHDDAAPGTVTAPRSGPRPATAGHGRVGAANCSASSARLDEPLPGTAPVARSWVLIEQPGPWGARALTESHFDAAVGAQLNAKSAGTGVRLGLIRRVGHHALPHDAAAPARPRRVLIATTRPGAATVRTLRFSDPHELLQLDFAALGEGAADTFARLGEPHPNPVLLVCTNGKRDRCCALLGRSLALDVAEVVQGTAPFELWEADHLGGHRFAPTAVVLPTGYVYGRLDAVLARAVVAAAGRGEVAADRCRGRSTWSRPGQAAELALRAQIQEFRADAVDLLGERALDPADPALASLYREAAESALTDAKLWIVDLAIGQDRYSGLVAEHAATEPRPESCGKAFGTPAQLHVLHVRKIG